MEAREEVAVVVNKGKRSKRSRSLSPLLLPLNKEFSVGGGGVMSDASGVSDAVFTPSPCNSVEITDEDLEEDMANCLILLARGHCQTESLQQPVAASLVSSAEVYTCRTCSKSFPSFQALGGHRASHKKPNKPPPVAQLEEKKALTEKKPNNFRSILDESKNLSLQIISSRSLGGGGQSIKSRVHECSICGAEFTSGQALGGHMRRHRPIPTAPGISHDQCRELKRPKNALSLDLNLPAPEDDRVESKLSYTPKEQVIVFSAPSLVDCHY